MEAVLPQIVRKSEEGQPRAPTVSSVFGPSYRFQFFREKNNAPKGPEVIHPLPISTNRFVGLSAQPVDRGSWAAVWKAYDTITDQVVALKIYDPTPLAQEQLRYRKQTLESVISREGGKLFQAAHVVPMTVQVDDKNQLYIVMPFYERFLSNEVSDFTDNRRSIAGNNLHHETVKKYLRNLASGLDETHGIYKQVHSDLTLRNIAISPAGELVIADRSAANYHAQARTVSPRDHIGNKSTRAPELFFAESFPTAESDIFSWGAIGYRLITGKYPYEHVTPLDAPDADIKIAETLENKLSREVLQTKLRLNLRMHSKDLPSYLVDQVSSALALNPNNRYPADGTQLATQLVQGEYAAQKKEIDNDRARRWSVPIAVTGGVIGLVASVAIFAKYAPEPAPIQFSGLVQIVDSQQNSVAFKIDPEYQPKGEPDGTQFTYIQELKLREKLAPKDLTVQYLVGLAIADLRNCAGPTKFQEHNLDVEGYYKRKQTYDPETFQNDRLLHIGASLDYAMSFYKNEKIVPLEDVLAISRVGKEWFDRAVAAKGPRFKDYKTARISDFAPNVKYTSADRQIFDDSDIRFVDSGIMTHKLQAYIRTTEGARSIRERK